MGQDLESRENMPSTPMLQQILHITMVIRCCIVLEQNDAMLKQFWLLTVKSWPHFILQDHTLIPIGMGWSNPSPFWLKNMTCMTVRAPDYATPFSCCVMYGHAIQHSLISAEGQMNASMTHQPSTCK